MPDEPGDRPAPRPSRSKRRPRAVTFAYPPATGPHDDQPALDLLSQGNLKVEGRLVAASNATLYCTVRRHGQSAACVYKPVAGERPLWDFAPGTLAGREVAATRARVELLIKHRVHPYPPENWPAVPWPPV